MSDEVPLTGDARVDAVLQSLDRLADLPVDDHAEVYDQIHGRLRAVLTQAGDDGPPRPSAP